MNDRRVEKYVSSYSIVREIIEDELGFPDLRELYRHLAKVTRYKHSTITQKFKGELAPDWFFTAIADFMANNPRDQQTQTSSHEYYARITAPLGEAEIETLTISASSPDLPDHPGDGPNVTPPPNNLLEELVQVDILISGSNYSEFGRFLLVELSFRNPSIDIGDEQFELHLTRCWLRLSLDSAMAERGEERHFQDKINSALRIKIGSGEGVGRTRSWEIAHLETADPLLGTFVIDPLCKIENELGPKDNARLVAKGSNVRVVRGNGTIENSEKQHVIDQLIRLRKLPIERDGTILFSLQKLSR